MSDPDNTGVELDFGFVSKCLDIKISHYSCMIGCVKWNSMPEAPRKGLKPLVYYYYHIINTDEAYSEKFDGSVHQFFSKYEYYVR